MNLLNLALLPFVVFAVHRLWTYEEIFAWPRWLVSKTWLSKPLLCPVCVAFWVALGCALVLPYAEHWALQPVWIALGLYPFVWWMIVAYGLAGRDTIWTFPATPKKAGCNSCGQKRKEIESEQKRARSFKRRVVVVLTGAMTRAHLQTLTRLLESGWFVKVYCRVHALSEMERGLLLGAQALVHDIEQLQGSATQKLSEGRLRQALMGVGNGIVLAFDGQGAEHAATWNRLCEFPAFGVVYAIHQGYYPPGFTGWLLHEDAIPGTNTLIARSPEDVPSVLDSIWQDAVTRNRPERLNYGAVDAR